MLWPNNPNSLIPSLPINHARSKAAEPKTARFF
jgi:hypothetical protein